MIGTILTTIVYILSTVVLFGILPNDKLQGSLKPFADAAQLISGDFGGYFVAIGVIISGLGVINGWILMVAQVPLATAQERK
jgi:APA family basic amino acid/polyamine antiporter